jgi:hypothetical protein
MSPDERAVAAAWLTAADDLGIRVIAPFTLTTAGGAAHPVAALLSEFGSPLGTLVCAQPRDSALRGVAAESGYRCVGLCADDYRHYNRELFVWLLDDLEWFGAKPRPGWHTGPTGTSEVGS